MKKLLLTVLILVLFIPVILQAQIKNADIPRSWWPELETFIRALADNQISYIMIKDSLVIAGGAIDTLGIFRYPRAVTIQQVTMSWQKATLSDSLILISLSGTIDTLCKALADTLSTGIGATYAFLENTTDVNFASITLDTLVIMNTGGTANTIKNLLITIYRKIR